MNAGINIRNGDQEHDIDLFEKTFGHPVPCVQIFTFSLETNQADFDLNDSPCYSKLVENGTRIYVHTTYKTQLSYHGGVHLAFEQYKHACKKGYNGIVIHLPIIELLNEEYGLRPTSILGGGKKVKIKKSNKQKYIDYLELSYKLFQLISMYIGSANSEQEEERRIIPIYFENMPCFYHSDPENLLLEISILKHKAAEIDKRIIVGLCLDTAHIFVSGYELASEDDAQSYFNWFDNYEPILIHLNDSVHPKGSKRDVHAPWEHNIWKEDRTGLDYILSLGYDCIREWKWY
jgi:hypothetical protein